MVISTLQPRLRPTSSHHSCCMCVCSFYTWVAEPANLWETFHRNFIYSQRFWQQFAARKLPKKCYSIFRFVEGACRVIWIEALRPIRQHTTYLTAARKGLQIWQYIMEYLYFKNKTVLARPYHFHYLKVKFYYFLTRPN